MKTNKQLFPDSAIVRLTYVMSLSNLILRGCRVRLLALKGEKARFEVYRPNRLLKALHRVGFRESRPNLCRNLIY